MWNDLWDIPLQKMGTYGILCDLCFLFFDFFQTRPAEVIPEKMIGFSNSAISILKEADFFVPDSKESGVIHMDLDRSFLPVPSAVNACAFESFVR